MVIHSKHAHQLFYGRRDPDGKLPNIVGLARFAAQAAQINSAAINNDPYADWTLIDIEMKMQKAEDSIEKQAESLKDLLDGLDGFEVDFLESEKPVTIHLKFQSPLAFKAARLLKKLDDVIMLALTARHQAIIGADDFQTITRKTSGSVRGTFELVNTWRMTGVTRHDFAANNQIAHRAKEIYSGGIHREPEIPVDILRGQVRSKFAPTIRDRSSESDITKMPDSEENETNKELEDAPTQG